MAVATRGGNVGGVIFHSDRGSQYTSAAYRKLCDDYGVKQSMGKTGVCWDNALAESFFATYKLELIEPRSWPTRARTRTATVHWIEAVYNRQRRHSAIDRMSPVDYEDRYWNRRAAA
jgi:transposase InsO family protein